MVFRGVEVDRVARCVDGFLDEQLGIEDQVLDLSAEREKQVPELS
jgi:sporulation-control protein spo0M